MAVFLKPALATIIFRLSLLLFLPIEMVKGAGDFSHFYHLAEIPGWPYLDYWVEYPPVFPFISKLLYLVTAGNQASYDFILFLLLLIFDLGSLWFFSRIAAKIWPVKTTTLQVFMFATVQIILPYHWWYFDPICVFFVLWGLFEIINNDNPVKVGGIVGIGVLVKFFPILLFAPSWGKYQVKRYLIIFSTGLILILGIFLVFYLVSPRITTASLISQGSKGSWESIWALIDGNYRTGLFGPLWERLDPSLASQGRGNPALIPSWFTLIPFTALGAWVVLRFHSEYPRALTASLLFSFCLLFLWSPGYSPQWLLYLIPLIFLVFKPRLAVLLNLILVVIHLAEWPFLLSAGQFWTLNITVPLRTGIYVLISILAYKVMGNKNSDATNTGLSSGL